MTALASGSGQVITSYYYDAFGVVLEENNARHNPYRYRGYFYDSEVKLYDLKARFYDAAMARFLQEDTYLGSAADPLSLNLYTYVSNNPLKYWDPTGHAGEVRMPDGSIVQATIINGITFMPDGSRPPEGAIVYTNGGAYQMTNGSGVKVSDEIRPPATDTKLNSDYSNAVWNMYGEVIGYDPYGGGYTDYSDKATNTYGGGTQAQQPWYSTSELSEGKLSHMVATDPLAAIRIMDYFGSDFDAAIGRTVTKSASYAVAGQTSGVANNTPYSLSIQTARQYNQAYYSINVSYTATKSSAVIVPYKDIRDYVANTIGYGNIKQKSNLNFLQIQSFYRINSYASEVSGDLSGNFIFAFEGAGDYTGYANKYNPDGRYGAMMIAVNNNKIIAHTKNASTLPNYPDVRQTLVVGKSEYDDFVGRKISIGGKYYKFDDIYPATIMDGIYSMNYTTHRGNMAIELGGSKSVRSVPAYRYDPSTGRLTNTSKNGSGILIHGGQFLSEPSAHSPTSTGCITISNNDYSGFIKAIDLKFDFSGSFIVNRSMWGGWDAWLNSDYKNLSILR